MNEVKPFLEPERVNALLAQTLKCVKDSVSITELDDTIIFVNEAFLAAYGYAEDELIGKKISMVRSPSVLPELGEALFHETKIHGWHGELINRRKDGSEFPIELWTSVVKDASGKPVATVGVARDITERKNIEQVLLSSREQLRDLAAHLQTVREEEDRRIAREIHDELGQILTGLKIDLKWLEKRITVNEHALGDKLASMTGQIDMALKTVRKISTELRPGVLELGLETAINWQAREFEERTGIPSMLSITVSDLELREEQSVNIFRIFQEILTNIIRHAQATGVDIRLEREGDILMLQVSDNGIGISEPKKYQGKSLGILGMRERALALGGTLEICGTEGKGTTVTLNVPLVDPGVQKGGRAHETYSSHR